MATAGTLTAHDAIESALNGQTRSPRKSATAGHEQAMARRLEQLHAALGTPAESPAQRTTAAKPASSSSMKLSSLILVSLTSAMVGAGTMRLALATDVPTREQPPIVASVAAATHAALPAEPVSPAPLIAAGDTDKAEIENLLESWRQAWQARNVAAYLETYGSTFKPVDGSSRENWVGARTKKLSTKADIEVVLRDIAMERIEPDLFKVSFLQSYASGNYREANRGKTLLLAREDGAWKIVREQQD